MESNSNILKQIIISPFSRKTHLTKKESPKNYWGWSEVIDDLRRKGVKTIQIGTDGEEDLKCNEFHKNLSPKDLLSLLKASDLFCGCDNFLPHFAHFYKYFNGIVLWSQSNPELFGYKEFTNLFVDKKYFRPGREQFKFWEDTNYIPEAFVKPEVVLENIYKKLGITIRT